MPILRRPAMEALLAVVTGFALAVAMTWPALRSPLTTIPHDLIDQALMGWEVQWGAHAMLTQPGRIFDGNAFYPEGLSYAFSDTLFGFWPLGLLLDGPRGAALAVNLIYLCAFALPSIGGYLLARQLGANRLGSAVAGLAVAYAPWRLTQTSHLHIISTGGMLLALAMLARGHGFSIRDGLRPERGHVGWIVAGWLMAAWQVTIGFGMGIPFVYVLLGIGIAAAVLWWRRGRPPVPTRVLVANAAGGLVFAAVCLFMARPYLAVLAQHPYARRSIANVLGFSPWPHGFLIGPGESLLWQHDPLRLRSTLSLPGEMILLPGFALLALGLLGIWVSAWSRPWRKWLGIGLAVSAVLTLGLKMLPVPPYLLLYALPGWDGIRTPGRLVVYTTLLLALLAAGAVTELTRRAAHPGGQREPLPRRLASAMARLRPLRMRLRPMLVTLQPVTRARLVGGVACALVLVEGLNVVEHVTVPAPPAALTAQYAQTVRAPLLVLPSDPHFDPLVMLWSTDGFPQMVNGLSGFIPASQAEIRAGTYRFPDAPSVQLLRRYGVRTVVVLPDRLSGTPWEGAADRPIAGLGITRTEIEDAIVFSLD